jgi:hypothetical protein
MIRRKARTEIAPCEGVAAAAGKGVMLDPRVLYRGGLAGWIPPWQYPLRGPMHEGVQVAELCGGRGANTKVRRVGVCRCCGIRT